MAARGGARRWAALLAGLLALLQLCASQESEVLWGQACDGLVSYARIRCIGSALARRVYGPVDVVPMLCEADRLVASRAVPDCHVIAQSVGTQLYNDILPFEEAKPDNLPTIIVHGMTRGNQGAPERAMRRALKSCEDSVCGQGCTHGAALAFVQHMHHLHGKKHRGGLGQNKDFMDAITHACQRAPGRAGGERGSDSLDCMQGLGHGLVRNGLLSLHEAASVCEAGGLRGDTGFPAACKRGAVLEYLQGAEELSLTGATSVGEGEGVRKIIRSLAMNPVLEMDVAGRLGGVLMVSTGHDLPRALGLCEGILGARGGVSRRDKQLSAKCQAEARAVDRRIVTFRGRLAPPPACAHNPTRPDWAAPAPRPPRGPAADLEGEEGGEDPAPGQGPRVEEVPDGCVIPRADGAAGADGLEWRSSIRLPFCGDTVQYPVSQPRRRTELFKRDQALSASWRGILAQLPNLARACKQRLRAELCRATFPLCTGGGAELEYCDVTPSQLPPGRVAVCRPPQQGDLLDTQSPAVVCATIPRGPVCVNAQYCKALLATGHAGSIARSGPGCEVKPKQGQCFYHQWAAAVEGTTGRQQYFARDGDAGAGGKKPGRRAGGGRGRAAGPAPARLAFESRPPLSI